MPIAVPVDRRQPTSSNVRWTCSRGSCSWIRPTCGGRTSFSPEEFPYTTQMGAVYDSGEYEKALDHALKTAGWD